MKVIPITLDRLKEIVKCAEEEKNSPLSNRMFVNSRDGDYIIKVYLKKEKNK